MNPSNLKESDVVKALPNFLNTFGTKYTNCCSCGEDYDDGLAASVSNSTEESLMSRKVLKEVCIKSIVPESRLLAETKLDDDSSYPFCSECTAGTVSKLTALFRQLQAVQEEFNELRCQVVSAIIRCYVSVHFNEDDDHHEESTRTHGIGETVFNHWKSLATRGFIASLELEQEVFKDKESQGGITIQREFDLSKVKTEMMEDTSETVEKFTEPAFTEPGTSSSTVAAVADTALEDTAYLDDMDDFCPASVEMDQDPDSVFVKEEPLDRIGNEDSGSVYPDVFGVVPQSPRDSGDVVVRRRGRPPGSSKKGTPTLKIQLRKVVKEPSRLSAGTRKTLKPTKASVKKKQKLQREEKKLQLKLDREQYKHRLKPRAAVIKARLAFKATFTKKKATSVKRKTTTIPAVAIPKKRVYNKRKVEAQNEPATIKSSIDDTKVLKKVRKIPINEPTSSATQRKVTADTAEKLSIGKKKLNSKNVEKKRSSPPSTTTVKENKKGEVKPLVLPLSVEGRRTRKRHLSRQSAENIECKPNFDLSTILGPVSPVQSDGNASEAEIICPSFSSDISDSDDEEYRSLDDKGNSSDDIGSAPHRKKLQMRRRKTSEKNQETDVSRPGDGTLDESSSKPKRKTGRPRKPSEEGTNEDDQNPKVKKKMGRPRKPEGEKKRKKPNPTGKKRIRYDRPSQCAQCGKILCSSYNLMLHIRTHTGEKPYACPHCPMRFPKPPNLRAHLLIHTKTKMYCCDICGATFTYAQVLRQHKASQHQVYDHIYTFECKYCLKKQITPGEMAKHLKIVHCNDEVSNPNMISPWCNIHCVICRLDLPDMETFNAHLKEADHLAALKARRTEYVTHKPPGQSANGGGNGTGPTTISASHGANGDVDGSEIVQKTEMILPDLPSTMISNQLNPNPSESPRMIVLQWPRKCTEEGCSMMLREEKIMRQHMQKCHRQRNHVCDVCGKAFLEKNHLKQHKIIHLDPGEKPFCCDECDESFNSQAGLTRHKTKHTGEGKQNCKYCQKPFHRIKVYRRHMCVHHADKYLVLEPFYCEVCYLTFRTPNELTEHRKAHEEFKCEQCGKMFEYKCELVSHIASHDRPFKCEQCEKTWPTESAMKDHFERRHAKEKSHKCDLCNVAFFGEKWLKNHIDRVHGMGPGGTPSRKSQRKPDKTSYSYSEASNDSQEDSEEEYRDNPDQNVHRRREEESSLPLQMMIPQQHQPQYSMSNYANMM